jgi:hypothetical protein
MRAAATGSSQQHLQIHQGRRQGIRRARERAYRFNHTREVVDLVDKYIFKIEITRNEDDAPAAVKAFWKHATLNGLPIKDFIKRISQRGSVGGRPWIVVDSTKGPAVRTVADAKKAKVRVYAYVVEPQHALDMSLDELGELNWILIREHQRDDGDAISGSGYVYPRFRLWTRTTSQLFVCVDKKGVPIDPEASASNKDWVVVAEPGRAPARRGAGHPGRQRHHRRPLLQPGADRRRRLPRSRGGELPVQHGRDHPGPDLQPARHAGAGLMPGTADDETKLSKLVELGTKRIFTFNGEGDAVPFYLSPDVKQADLILRVISKIINEIYHSVGLAGERTKEDNSQGIDNSSGVAKGYDFERVNALLCAKADSLERIENRMAFIVALYAGEEKKLASLERPLVLYADDFDVRGLYDEFEIAARLELVSAPDTVRRQHMERTIDKLFPQLKKELRDKMMSELKTWPPKLDPMDPTGGAGGTATLKKAGSNRLANSLVK